MAIVLRPEFANFHYESCESSVYQTESFRPQSGARTRPQSASSSCVLQNVRALELVKKTQSRDNQTALQRDWQYCLDLVKLNPEGLKLADEELLKDREFILQAVAQNGMALEFVADEFKADEDVVLAAVAQNGLALKFMDASLANDFSFTIRAIDLNAEAIVGATEYWHGDPELLIHTAPQLKNDHDFAVYMVRHRGMALRSVSNALRADKDVVYAAVQSDGLALQFAAPSLLRNNQIVRKAVCQNGLALEFAAAEPRDNTGIVMAAVASNALALEFASDIVKNDMSVVTFAARRNIHCLRFASFDVRAEKRFMQMIMKIDGIALQYADARLQSDVETVVYALQSNWEASKYAGAKALKSKLVQRELARSRQRAEREKPDQKASESSFVNNFRKRFTQDLSRVGDVGDAKLKQKHAQSPNKSRAAKAVESGFAKIRNESGRLFPSMRSGYSQHSIITQNTEERAKITEQGEMTTDDVVTQLSQENLARSRIRPSSAPAATERETDDLGPQICDAIKALQESRAQRSRPQTAPTNPSMQTQTEPSSRPSSASRMQQVAHRQKLAVFNAKLAQGDGWMSPPKDTTSLHSDPARQEVQKKVLAGRPQSAASRFSSTPSGTGTSKSPGSRPSSAGTLQQDLRELRASSKASLTPGGKNKSSSRPTSAKGVPQNYFGAEIGWAPTGSLWDEDVEAETEYLEAPEAPEDGKRPFFANVVSYHEFPAYSERSNLDVDITSTVPPPLPAFSANVRKAEASADAVIVWGGSAKYANCMGTYVKTDVGYTSHNGGRAIFKGPEAKYMFYWAEINKWIVGDDYNCKKGWLCSTHSESYCPTLAAGWKEWDVDSGSFKAIGAIKVQMVNNMVMGHVAIKDSELVGSLGEAMPIDLRPQACVDAVIVGGDSKYPTCLGTYVKTDIRPGPNHGGRAIFKGPAAKYLFYCANINKWIVGDDYNCRKGWLSSNHCNGFCPTHATAWKEWDVNDKTFKCVDAIKVQMVTHWAYGSMDSIEASEEMGIARQLVETSVEEATRMDHQHHANFDQLEDQFVPAQTRQSYEARMQLPSAAECSPKTVEWSPSAAECSPKIITECSSRTVEWSPKVIITRIKEDEEEQQEAEEAAMQVARIEGESTLERETEFRSTEEARLSPNENSHQTPLLTKEDQLQVEGNKCGTSNLQDFAQSEPTRLPADVTQAPSMNLSAIIRDHSDPRQCTETAKCIESDSVSSSSSQWEYLQNEHARLLANSSENATASALTPLLREGDELLRERAELHEEKQALCRQRFAGIIASGWTPPGRTHVA